MKIGIDLGGTKIETIVIDSLKGELLRRRISTPQNNYQATLVAICGLVDEVENELGGRVLLALEHLELFHHDRTITVYEYAVILHHSMNPNYLVINSKGKLLT